MDRFQPGYIQAPDCNSSLLPRRNGAAGGALLGATFRWFAGALSGIAGDDAARRHGVVARAGLERGQY